MQAKLGPHAGIDDDACPTGKSGSIARIQPAACLSSLCAKNIVLSLFRNS
jgi:hypothetical protein